MATVARRIETFLKVNPLHLSWGVGSLGTVTMISAVSNLYLFFLTTVLMISPAMAGILIFVSKLFDTVTDPAVGWFSDKSSSRWGRRRPFMMVGTILCPLTLLLLFSPPSGLSGDALQAFVLIALLLYAAALTLFNVPYLAMPAEMTDDYHERSSIMSYRAAFLVGGGFVGGSIAGPIIASAGGGAEGYSRLGYILAAIVFVAMLIATWGTRSAPHRPYDPPRVPRLNQAKLFLVNRPFLFLSGVKALQFLQLAASGASTLFFFLSVMEKDEALLFPFGAAVIAGSLISLRIWLPIMRKLGKKQVLVAALLVQALLYASWMLATPTEPMAVFLARAFFLGTMGGAVLIASQSMIVDTIEYDRRISGLNREGLYSSVFSFVEKTMHATGPLLVGVTLSLFGYDASIPRGQAQPDEALVAIYFGQSILPALCSLGMAGLLIFYRLDETILASAQLHPLGKVEDKPTGIQEGNAP